VKTITVIAVACCCVLCVLSGSACAQPPDQFESLLASAQQAQARSDFQAAADLYRQAVALHPEIPELKANLGLMYYQTGKDEQASEAFLQALRLKPGLFVPNLFLGLEYVKGKRFSEAVSCFKQAERVKPGDVQVQLGLGQAYAGSGKTRLASAAYARASQIDSGNADAWYHLGVSYLEQVEADARILLTRHKESAHVQLLMAETFAEQRALVQAEDAYKKVLAFPKPIPGAHAGYAFVLLNRHDLSAAERELKAEIVLNPGSLMAKLGAARLHLEQGAAAQAVREIGEIEKTDAGFLRANVPLFSAGVSQAKRAALRGALEQGQASGEVSEEVVTLFRDSATGGVSPGPMPERAIGASASRGAMVPPGDAVKLYANGSYGECDAFLASRLQRLPAKDIQLLASCAYLTGDYPSALKAAAKLASNPSTEAEGLYWETKSAQRLAAQALARASAADPNSPKLHVLLGDIYRQQKAFPDAEQEYRKALALRPEDNGALFGLSLALLADGQNDEALSTARAALQKNPDDPELNAVMGEILCVRDDFLGAEPYLKKSLNTKPEFVSRVHALLGNVYAKTDRTQQAIAELKLGLASDKDGSLHYQIARLYLKVGDRDSAKQAFAVSKQLQQQGLMHATVAMQQGEGDSEFQ
jgi:tetratricopeptide (TPR) repeat protein